jgi:cytochrome P450
MAMCYHGKSLWHFLFYIDTWPFGPPMLVATSPDSANQITIAHSLAKFIALREYMKPMTGGMDLRTLEGSAWKTWRNVFQPGFNSGHLMTKVPEMIEDILIFCENLRAHAASGEVFQMDPLTVNLNLDIIGRLDL